jgi:hypothetical protein
MGKNRSASGLTNVIQYDNNGNIAFVSGSTTLMQVSSSGAITTTGTISGGAAADALLLNGTGSLAFVTTASYNVASSSFSSRTTQVERTYATTGSNTFTGAQFASDTSNAISFTSTASLYSDGGLRVQGNSFVSGTAYFNNIVVYGTSSIQYITSSQVNVGTNIITVNTDTPAVRFGGLAVFDSGSTQLTGSILWDSEKNHWVYSNPSGSTYSGGMFISGPRSSALGSEQGTTACMLLVGQGSDHLTSSMIYHDSNRTCFYTNATLACSNNFGSNLNLRQTFTGSFYQSGSIAVFNSCVGVRTTTPRSALHVQQVTNDGVPSVGCARDGLIISSNNGNYGLNIGVDPTGPTWMQSMRFDDGATAYNLLLQPVGGCSVLIGTGTALAGARQQLVIGGNGFGSLIAMGNNGNGNKFVIESDSSENVLINNKSNTPMIFYTNNSRRFDITSGGIACFACQVCAPSFVGGTISGTGITGTSMTVATDCSGVIVDVASRHGLMKYFNFSTGFVGACSGTDGSVSTWLGRFAGSITAPTAVYQDLRILNSGIAVFACQVCTPVALIGSTCTTGAGINFLGREGYREKWLITQGRWRFCFGTEDFYGAIFIEMYGTNYNQGTSEVRVGKAAIPLRYGQSRSISNIYQLGGVCVGAYLANGIGLVWCNINGTVGDLIYTNAGSRDPDSVLATELQLLSTGFSLAGRFYRMCYTNTLYESTNPYV